MTRRNRPHRHRGGRYTPPKTRPATQPPTTPPAAWDDIDDDSFNDDSPDYTAWGNPYEVLDDLGEWLDSLGDEAGSIEVTARFDPPHRST